MDFIFTNKSNLLDALYFMVTLKSLQWVVVVQGQLLLVARMEHKLEQNTLSQTTKNHDLLP